MTWVSIIALHLICAAGDAQRHSAALSTALTLAETEAVCSCTSAPSSRVFQTLPRIFSWSPQCSRTRCVFAPGSMNFCLRKASVGALGPFNNVRGSYEVLECAVQETQEPAHYVEGSQYLKSLGFQHASEVARVLDVAMNPTSIYLQNKHKRRAVNVSVSVEAMRPCCRSTCINSHMQPCVCLDAVELSVQARKLNVQDDMVPVCQFLQSQGMSDAQVVTVRLYLNAIAKHWLLWHSTHVLSGQLGNIWDKQVAHDQHGMIGFKLYKLVSQHH